MVAVEDSRNEKYVELGITIKAQLGCHNNQGMFLIHRMCQLLSKRESISLHYNLIEAHKAKTYINREDKDDGQTLKRPHTRTASTHSSLSSDI